VVQNAGFDQSSSGWTMSPLATFDASKDADSCSGSGSIRVTVDPATANFGSFSRCVPVSENTQYFWGYQGWQGQSGGLVCYLTFFAGTTCSGNQLSSEVLQATSPLVGVWTTNSASASSPATAGSATIFCQLSGLGPGWFDQIYVDTVNRY
jgi:hypothetical protein